MTTAAPLVYGPLASHPSASAFAREVVRVNRRYAVEIVAAYRLCPFVRDVDVAFGRFCVALTPRADLDEARAAFIRAESPVLHMVYPLERGKVPDFERFGADLGRAARDVWRSASSTDPRFGPEAPVIATFHPQLAGERTSPHRLIGLLRRAPDPFVQIIPGGHHEGGTVVASLADVEKLTPESMAKLLAKVSTGPKDRAHETYERLSAADLDRIAAVVADIHADRDRSYAPFLAELGGA